MNSKPTRFAKLYASPTLHKKLTVVLAAANVCVLALYVAGWTSGAQSRERVVAKSDVIKNEPVEIDEIRARGKSVKAGEAFEDGEEWLKNIDFRLTNRWDKVITYVVLNVDFPETKKTGSVMMHSLYLGQQPDVKSTLSNAPLRLAPGQSVDVSLAPEFEWIKKSVETRQPPIGNIHEIKVWLDQVMFEDGTVYAAGGLYGRNPDRNSPQKWVPLINKQSAPSN